ncbi:MAG: dUTP diphosphatase [Actinomycetota bacterium]|jgi:dUTP pyrophosphatase
MEVHVHLDNPSAHVPTYAHLGDAGCDLFANETVTLAPAGGRAVVGTGFSMALPDGFGGFVLPRSGLATKHGVTCANAPGLIDAGYRGEVRVSLVNLDPTREYRVNAGDRIAQLVVLPVPRVAFTLVDELPPATRGDAGFGSTGV